MKYLLVAAAVAAIYWFFIRDGAPWAEEGAGLTESDRRIVSARAGGSTRSQLEALPSAFFNAVTRRNASAGKGGRLFAG